jgi:protein SCO1/2
MNRKRLLITAILLLVAAGSIMVIYRSRRPAAIPAAKLRLAQPKAGAMPAVWDAPAFSFVNQDNQPITGGALRGKVWVADFIFTQCGNTCPIMTAKMVELQKQITDPGVMFVSFSVDPDRDKPAELKAYAIKYGVDQSRWHFLAAPDATSILDVAIGMRITGRPKEGNNPLLHADRFVLIDQRGKVRGSYYEGDAEAMRRLVADAGALARMHARGD